MKGLKRVTQRRDDALARVGWDHLETLLAAYYRSEGYQVEHVGTGATGAKFDGGIDLKLRRGEQYIVVQCKHWNAMKVPHNAVHELLGLMVNEGATGAILATSGEFTKAAIEAATRLGHVHLIDGDELRVMLGPVREPEPSAFDSIRMGGEGGTGSLVARRVGERLLSAEDRIRYGTAGGHRRVAARSFGTLLVMKLLGLALTVSLLAAIGWLFTRYITAILTPPPVARSQPSGAPATVVPVQAVTDSKVATYADACHEVIDKPSGTYIDHCAKTPMSTVSADELRKQKRDADAAIETIADSTPEM
ncbi:restriction endonuclease [Lysobacter niastensis]|uniref:Restriction endonuclease n=1 Tax=Lysobacter niastensis TaxID=380629 RepID=A0ABS0B4L3_9GAMM|nr:restriction endonuclease [Lysobacter niastensis]MBF6023438.1 restriction endonuclease [Lysobacter niastensis]